MVQIEDVVRLSGCREERALHLSIQTDAGADQRLCHVFDGVFESGKVGREQGGKYSLQGGIAWWIHEEGRKPALHVSPRPFSLF